MLFREPMDSPQVAVGSVGAIEDICTADETIYNDHFNVASSGTDWILQ